MMHDWFGGFDASLKLIWDWNWHLRLTSNGVPLRQIASSSVSAFLPQTLPNSDTWSRDLALLGDKHGLQDLNPPQFEQPRPLLELIVSG